MLLDQRVGLLDEDLGVVDGDLCIVDDDHGVVDDDQDADLLILQCSGESAKNCSTYFTEKSCGLTNTCTWTSKTTLVNTLFNNLVNTLVNTLVHTYLANCPRTTGVSTL